MFYTVLYTLYISNLKEHICFNSMPYQLRCKTGSVLDYLCSGSRFNPAQGIVTKLLPIKVA